MAYPSLEASDTGAESRHDERRARTRSPSQDREEVMSINPDDIRLEQTCSACPEQYDAYYGGRVVGCLQLRWGRFRVDYGVDTVYSVNIEAGLLGIFEDEAQRQRFLRKAQRIIAARIDIDAEEQK